MTYGLVHADALHIPLADESVDVVATSPPYFALRSYQDDGTHYDGQIGSEPTPADFLAALWAVTDELWRVLKPTGSCWINLGDKYGGSPRNMPADVGLATGRQTALSDTRTGYSDEYRGDVPAKSLMGLPWRYALGLICPDEYRPGGGPQWVLRAEVIWSKPNGLPESVTDRVRRSHEQWFHFVKAGRYFAAVDEIRDRHVRTWAGTNGGRGGWDRGDHLNAGLADAGPHPLGALPGSVWTIPSEPLAVPDDIGVDHFAAFPQEWPRRIILGWTPSGICVKCGEGRRPVVEKGFTKKQENYRKRPTFGGELSHGKGSSAAGYPIGTTEATITGYACACDVPIAATRPAVVLDPFAGTGTVPMVARALGRFGIGLDLSRDYLRLARWRITSDHARKAINRTNRERQGVLW